ncbi:MAG: hypothetical protein ABI539_08580 [Acidobacteriota bacterium]
MTMVHFSIRVLVFAGALLLGITAVSATRFVISTTANVIRPASVSERVVSNAEQEPAAVIDAVDRTVDTSGETYAFDPSGEYSLDTDTVPRAFADIEYLTITAREYREENGTYVNRPIVPVGTLKSKRDLQLTKIAIADREISFETDSVDGISYQFVGQFPISSEIINCETCEFPGDLNGYLIKLKNGKVIAQFDANFYSDGC